MSTARKNELGVEITQMRHELEESHDATNRDIS